MLNAVRFTQNWAVQKLQVYALLLIALSSVALAGCSGLVTANNSGGGTPQALTISGVQAAAPTTSGFQVNWSTNVAANSAVDFGTTANYGSSTPTDSAMVVNHQIALTGLTAGTLYHFRVRSTDAKNSSASGPDTTFSTAPNTSPPTVSITSPAANATLSGVVTVAANATANAGAAVASVQFKVDSANTGAAITAAPYNYSLNTSTLSNGNHILTAVASDIAGNTATSAGVAVKVSNTVTAVPSITSLNPTSGPVGTSVTIVGANFGATQGTSTVAFNGTAASATSWSVASITAAVPSGATTGNVVVTVGGVASNGVGFTVQADTIPPTVPTGLTATAISSSQINLTWTASTDNVGVTGYNIFRGGAKIGTAPGTSFQDAGLNASTSYTYNVSAFDAAGNTSAQSAGASATTQAVTSGGGIPSSLGWYDIPNTKFQTVQQTSWPAAGDPAMVMVAWGGGAYDSKRNRLIVWGGGHGDYKGNEVYALDLNATPIAPLRLNEPNQFAPDGTCHSPFQPGSTNPSSRHTYEGLIYLPTQDRMFVQGGSEIDSGCFGNDNWLFAPGTLSWTQGPGAAWASGIPYCDYNPTHDEGLCFDDANGDLWVYNPAANTMSSQSPAHGSFPADSMSAVVDPDGKRFYLVGGGELGYFDISGTAPYPSRVDLSPAGCATFASGHHPGVQYDPVLKMLVEWHGGDSVNTYNPATNSCSSITYAGGPGLQQAHGTNGRFRYVTGMGIYVLCNAWAQDCFSLRLTAPSGGTGPTGPAISSVSVNSISTSTAIITWTTDVGATTQVEYGTTTAYGTLTTLNASLVTTHSVALSGLSLGTLYHYRVHSKNSGGTESISGDFAFSTNSTVDTTPPTVNITLPAIGATLSGTVTLTANATDNVGVTSVQFLLDGANVGAPLPILPYSLPWDTTTTSNGSHTISAQASDAAGNIGTAVGIPVTVSNSTSTATQNFQLRCAQPGVLACQGFDDPAIFSSVVNEASLTDGFGTASHPNLTRDTSVFASGGSSANFFIPAGAGENSTGNFWSFFGQGANNQFFGQNSTFYVQYAFRADAAWTATNWTQFGGPGQNTAPKLSIFHNSIAGSCALEEITVHNHNAKNLPTVYTECGSRQAITGSDGAIYNESGSLLYFQQGWTAAAPFTGYQCEYNNGNFSGPNCFHFLPNQWYTIYFKIHVGTWGNPNSSIEAWIAPYGQQMTKWLNTNNYIFNSVILCFASGSGPGSLPCHGFNTVELTQFMTGKISGTGPAAHVWYDELIISSQPIPAPAGSNP